MQQATQIAKAGGIVAGLNNGVVTYCYNTGEVTNQAIPIVGEAIPIGGICAVSTYQEGTTNGSRIQYCYNQANVISKAGCVGGICGDSFQYCYVRDCQMSPNAIIQKVGNSNTTTGLGNESNAWVGRMIGRNFEKAGGTYIGDNSLEDITKTVYEVVNGLKSGQSQYWSQSNLNAPKLLWEY